MENTYQGYKNRSTWLAVLWLDNTSPQVHEEAKRLARKRDIIGLLNLIESTGFSNEREKNINEVETSEVIEHLREL
jgi:hypothetical protein